MTSERHAGTKIEHRGVDDFAQERLQSIFADKAWAEEALDGGGAPEQMKGFAVEGAKRYVRMLKSYTSQDRQMAYDDFTLNYRLPLHSGLEQVGISGAHVDELGRQWYGAEQIIGSSLRLLSSKFLRDELVAFDQWREGVDGQIYDLLEGCELEYLDYLQWMAYGRGISLSGLEDSLRKQSRSLEPHELTAAIDSVRLSARQRLHEAIEHGNVEPYQLSLLIGRAYAYNPETLVQANYSLRDSLS